MRVIPGLLLLAALVSAQPRDLEAALRGADRDAARRLLSVAHRAESDGQRAVAAALFARVIELEPREAAARVRLGFHIMRGEWERTPEEEAEVKARTDTDAARAQGFRDRAAEIEERRTTEIIRLCAAHGTPEEREAVLAPMLEAMPDRADLHEALGHVLIDGHWVIPALVPAAQLLPLRLRAWRSHAEDPVAVEPSGLALRVPGVEAPLTFRSAEGCDVASAPDLGSAPAEAVARVRAFLRFLLGPDAALWTPPPLVFLGHEPYIAMVRALHPAEDEFALYSRYENYQHKDFYAIRAYDAPNAAERYAHGAGYLTMCQLVAKEDANVHAWLLEGFGYLVSLEIFDAGNVSYASLDESQAKTKDVHPPPSARTRAACLAWVRQEMSAGRGHALTEICMRSLNQLDLCGSLQAYSFVRFLFIFDPEAAKKLPAALREAKGGTQADRVDCALREAFGKGLPELERLWRAFPVNG